MNDYNTGRPPLILKEYGRNIQNLVDYLKTIEDKEKRSEYAYLMVDLMKQIHPLANENVEIDQKLWDDLYIISDFSLDVDSPFPMPSRDVLDRKPEPLGYTLGKVRYKHYGKNIELLVQKAINLEDPEEKEAAVILIGKLMKTYHTIWNKDNIDDATVLANIQKLSDGQLDLDLKRIVEENLFESTYKERRSKPNNGKNRRGGYKQNKNANQNNRRRRN